MPAMLMASPAITLGSHTSTNEATLQAHQQVKCVFNRLQKRLKIEKVHWKRAQYQTRTGAFDGFYPATQNAGRDSYARHSEPLFTLHWLYVSKKSKGITADSANFADYSIGANAGSARFEWLEQQLENGRMQNKIIGLSDSKLVFKMMMHDKLDIALLNNVLFEEITELMTVSPGALAPSHVSIKDLTVEVFRKRQSYVYFSKAFLNNHPGFMAIFNFHLPSCR